MLKVLKKYPATLSYLLFIVLLNTLFVFTPALHLWGQPVSIADVVVGFIYVMRDFAQRETKHWVIVAMLLGCFISWLLSEQTAAVASVGAFAVGEFVDWGIFTWTKKPFFQRVLISSIISAPFDTVVNLYLLSQLNIAGLILMTIAKVVGVLGWWWYTRRAGASKVAAVTNVTPATQ